MKIGLRNSELHIANTPPRGGREVRWNDASSSPRTSNKRIVSHYARGKRAGGGKSMTHRFHLARSELFHTKKSAVLSRGDFSQHADILPCHLRSTFFAWSTFKLHASTGRGSKSFAFGLELTRQRFSTDTVKSVGEGLRHKHHEKMRSDAGSLKNLLKTLTKLGGSFCVRSSKPLVGCGQRLSESPAGTNILRWVNWRRHYPMARNEP